MRHSEDGLRNIAQFMARNNELTKADGNQWLDDPRKHNNGMQITNRDDGLIQATTSNAHTIIQNEDTNTDWDIIHAHKCVKCCFWQNVQTHQQAGNACVFGAFIHW